MLNRSFLKIHEKNGPNLNQSQHQQQHDDVHSFSESECGKMEKYHSNKISKQDSSSSSTHHYAESLQDYDLSSQRMRRTNSGNSMHSATSSHAYFSEDGVHGNEAKPVKISPPKVGLKATISNGVPDDLPPVDDERKKLNSER